MHAPSGEPGRVMGPPPESTCAAPPSVRFEIASEAFRPDFPDLVPQTLRAIPPGIPHLARSRRVPHAPATSAADIDHLAWEYGETAAFIGKQLKKDPRLKPDDMQLSFEHLDSCQSCKNYAQHHASLHSSPRLEIGTRPQLLVDDFVVERWTNLVRFLNSPASRKPVLHPAPMPRDGSGVRPLRFGCPCSVVRDAAGYRLWHTGNGKKAQTRVNDRFGVRGLREPTAFVRRSADGLTGWSEPQPVLIDGKEPFGTFAASAGAGASAGQLVAGYEGKRARACLASSSDGVNWRTVAAKGGAAGRGGGRRGTD